MAAHDWKNQLSRYHEILMCRLLTRLLQNLLDLENLELCHTCECYNNHITRMLSNFSVYGKSIDRSTRHASFVLVSDPVVIWSSTSFFQSCFMVKSSLQYVQRRIHSYPTISFNLHRTSHFIVIYFNYLKKKRYNRLIRTTLFQKFVEIKLFDEALHTQFNAPSIYSDTESPCYDALHQITSLYTPSIPVTQDSPPQPSSSEKSGQSK